MDRKLPIYSGPSNEDVDSGPVHSSPTRYEIPSLPRQNNARFTIQVSVYTPDVLGEIRGEILIFTYLTIKTVPRDPRRAFPDSAQL